MDSVSSQSKHHSTSQAQNGSANDSKEKENTQILFLKQLVSRLNAELARCRNLGKITGDPTPLSELLASGDALWLWDASTLSPLLHGQDEYITELQKKVSEYEKELPALAAQCQTVLAENERLHKQLECQHQTDHDTSHPSAMTSRMLSQQNQQLRKALQHTRGEADGAIARAQGLSEALARGARDRDALAAEVAQVRGAHDAACVRVRTLEDAAAASAREVSAARERAGYWEERALRAETLVGELAQQHQALVSDFRDAVHEKETWVGRAQGAAELEALVARSTAQLAPLLETARAHDAARAALAEAAAAQHTLVLERDDARARCAETQALLSTLLESSVAKHEVLQMKKEMQAALEATRARLHAATEKEVKQRCHLERALRDKRTVESALKKCQEDARVDKERIAMEIAGLHGKLRHEAKQTIQLKGDFEILQAKYETESTKYHQEKQILTKDLDHQLKLVRRAFSDIEHLKSENQSLLKSLEEFNKTYDTMVVTHQEELRQHRFPNKANLRKQDAKSPPLVSAETHRIPPVGV